MRGNTNQTVIAVTITGRDRSIYWPELLGKRDAEAVAAKLSDCGFIVETWPVRLKLPDPSSLSGPAIEPWNKPSNLEAVASPGQPLYESEEEYRSSPFGKLFDESSAEGSEATSDTTAPEPPKRGYDGRIEPFETFDAAFVVRSVVQVPVDCEPVPLPRMLIERHPESFCVHDYEFRDEGAPGDGPLVERKSLGGFHPARAEKAWNTFSHCLDCQNVSVFVGPGSSPVALEGAVADPRYFQVWSADEAGIATFVGQSVHRLIAMGMAKQVVAAGGCPVVMSHYLEPDHEWECDSIEELPAPAKLRKARRAAR